MMNYKGKRDAMSGLSSRALSARSLREHDHATYGRLYP